MTAAATDAVCAEVYRRFPELAGVRPTVRRTGQQRIFSFEKTVAVSPGGPRLRQIVNVTTDETGRIVRLVASR